MKTLAERIDRLLPGDGRLKTAIPGLTVCRVSTPGPRVPLVYEPCVCIVASGHKHAFLGAARYVYDAGNFLVLAVPLPLECEIAGASAGEPYRALIVDLDLDLLTELVLAMEGRAGPPRPCRGIFTAPMCDGLATATLQLLDCLDDPATTDVLAPLALRTMLIHLLRQDADGHLRALAQQNPHARSIARVIAHLRAHYTEPITVAELARMAHMSASSFYTHFKAVTDRSPLQYLKAIRLHEARRLMLNESTAASDAAYRVGYRSPSQFSREFKRLFGAPPTEDLRRQRAIRAAAPGRTAPS